MKLLFFSITSFPSPENKFKSVREKKKTLPWVFHSSLDTAQIILSMFYPTFSKKKSAHCIPTSSPPIHEFNITFTQQNWHMFCKCLAVNPFLITQEFLSIKFINISQSVPFWTSSVPLECRLLHQSSLHMLSWFLKFSFRHLGGSIS